MYFPRVGNTSSSCLLAKTGRCWSGGIFSRGRQPVLEPFASEDEALYFLGVGDMFSSCLLAKTRCCWSGV